jgi:hypothetical protein
VGHGVTGREPERPATERKQNQSPHMPTYIVEQILDVQQRLENALPWERQALKLEVARLRKLAKDAQRR